MNRAQERQNGPGWGMPHVCGDEPLAGKIPPEDLRMPHVCGDEPGDDCVAIYNMKYAPRMWG